VYEPPSEHLVRQLTELQLCHPRDLRRARGRVRRLSFDLPAFDSVWIDSLVQLRLLTPYQAKQLESGRGESLRVGPFVAIDELGRSKHGSTILARRLNRRDRCVVRREQLVSDRSAQVLSQMELVLEQLKGFVHPYLVVPHEILPIESNELVLISRYVPGLPLNELLVRRGRFPAAVVVEIGRQLLEGLAAVNTRSVVHGDIRLSNIRLTENGLAVLVNGGVRQVIRPHLTIHDALSIDHYDGMAPELIGTGAAATASSELYSLGCVLWQLLAGRPPFVSADPLVKIASHQTQTIDDVRKWAPDTPAMLADSIRQLTSSSPSMRPRSFEEVLQHWGTPGSQSRSRIRKFRRLFDGAMPHFSEPAADMRIGNWAWMAAAVTVVAAGLALSFDNGLRNELLNVARNVEAVTHTARNQQGDTKPVQTTDRLSADQNREFIPLPAPSNEGVILLTERGPYEATSISLERHLTIRGSIGAAAEIHVGNVPLNLSSDDVVLENVTIRRSKSADHIRAPLVTVRSQSLRIWNCEVSSSDVDHDSVDNGSGEASRQRPGVAAIAWMSPQARDPKMAEITIRNSAFYGDGVSVALFQTPRSVTVQNTLKTGDGVLFSLGSKCLATEFAVQLDRVTLRDSGSMLWIAGDYARTNGLSPIAIQANNCVFKLEHPDSGLIVIDSDRPRTDLAKSIEMKTQESVVEPGTVLLVAFDRSRNRLEHQDDEQFEGLVAAEIKFAGIDARSPIDSTVAHLVGPRMSEKSQPGIDPHLIGAAPPQSNQ
jgi:eukaryotic-like serine/threonine-protein kinase